MLKMTFFLSLFLSFSTFATEEQFLDHIMSGYKKGLMITVEREGQNTTLDGQYICDAISFRQLSVMEINKDYIKFLETTKENENLDCTLNTHHKVIVTTKTLLKIQLRRFFKILQDSNINYSFNMQTKVFTMSSGAESYDFDFADINTIEEMDNIISQGSRGENSEVITTLGKGVLDKVYDPNMIFGDTSKFEFCDYRLDSTPDDGTIDGAEVCSFPDEN